MKKKWLIPKHKGIPLIEWLYSQRNIVNPTKYFDPVITDLANPFAMLDMDKAVDFIKNAAKENKQIFIHGDFDADGITATSIVWLFLSKYLKANVLPYIPSRFYEGYGLTEESISNIKAKGGEVIITVDCGIKDIELVNKYSKELDFIITDHHTIRIPESKKIKGSKEVGGYLISSKAKAVVHPALSNIDFKEICGAMVAFKLCSAINQKLKLNIDMAEFADLCAIGTVCDVMPLVDENRIIVQLGLQKLSQGNNIGLNFLKKTSGIKNKILAYHLGFVLGPRLNAAGRLGDALDAVRLLTTSSPLFAKQMAEKLEALNLKRKELTDKYFKIAENEIKKADSKIFVFFGEDWPEGLLGLIAGKLSEKYNKPVIIGAKGEITKASARSPEYFNIAEFIEKFSPFFEKFGGHAQAAGLTVTPGQLEEFLKAIEKELENLNIPDTQKVLQLDASLDDFMELNIETAQKIANLEPFGTKNPKPVLYIPNLKIKNVNYMGSNNEHIKLNVMDTASRVMELIGFNQSEIYNDLLSYSTLPLELAATLELDEWNGFKKVSLRIIDLRIQE